MEEKMKSLALIAVVALTACSTSLERPGDSIHVVQGLRIVAFCQKNPAHPGCVHHAAAAAKLNEYRAADRADYRDSVTGNTPAMSSAPLDGSRLRQLEQDAQQRR
jgi:hypothetical protein